MKVKTLFHFGTVVSILLTVILGSLSSEGGAIVRTLAVVSGCLSFHLLAWIVSAILVVGVMKNNADDSHLWFRELPWERGLYKLIGIRKWKRHLPTYAPQYYDFGSIKNEELLGIISQTEIVHEVAAVLSALSVIGARWFDHLPVFLVLAFADFATNVVYAFLQRYNRLRLRRLIKARAAQSPHRTVQK